MFFFVACSNHTNKKGSNKEFEINFRYVNVKYQEMRLTILNPGLFFDHFPNEITTLPIECSFEKEQNSIYQSFMMLVRLPDKKVQNNIIDSLKNSLSKLPVNVNHDFCIIKQSDNYKYVEKCLKEGQVPIPYFDGYTFDDSSMITDALTIDSSLKYVVEYRSIFNRNTDVYMKRLKLLPRTHSKGYCKGVYINRKYIMYWTIFF